MVGDYKENRGRSYAENLGGTAEYVYIDAVDGNTVVSALKNADCCIAALKQIDPRIQSACLKEKVHCIDVSVSIELYRKIFEYDNQCTKNNIIFAPMTGYFPGLSAMLLTHLLSSVSTAEQGNIALLLSGFSHYNIGVSGVTEMFSNFAGTVTFDSWEKPKIYSSFSRKRKMLFTMGDRR